MVDPKIITHPHGDRTFTSALYYGADVRESLRRLQAGSVQCVVTSPPYWGLRSYLGDGDPLKGSEIGSEPTPEEYVNSMVDVFREVKRVLRDDGVLWLNLGDSYAVYHGNSRVPDADAPSNKPGYTENQRSSTVGIGGLKAKDLVGIPWRVALALQADGWYLRSDVIWAKGSCMPESVTDRPTRSHEYVFLLTKNARYFYDADAVKEPLKDDTLKDLERHGGERGKRERNVGGRNDGYTVARGTVGNAAGRNRRTVWSLATESRPVARLRPDLTPEQRAYVVVKLTALGLL